MAIPLASSGPEKSLAQNGFDEKKKANFVDSRKLLLRGYKLKKPNTTDLETDLQRSRLTKSTEADVNALRRSIELFFFFFF